MTHWTLVKRSLTFRFRAHLGVALGATVGTTALVGALLVGDSVRGTLVTRGLQRLGPTHYALFTPDRFFQADLKARLCQQAQRFGSLPLKSLRPGTLLPSSTCPLAVGLMLPGIANTQDGSARANAINVIGVESPTWPRLAGWGNLSQGIVVDDLDGSPVHFDEVTRMELGRGQGPLTGWKAGETAVINRALADQLHAKSGDELIVRVRKPSALAADAVITPKDQGTVALRLRVGPILGPDRLGDLSLTASQILPLNLFLPLGILAGRTDLRGRANLLLNGPVLVHQQPSWWDLRRDALANWLRWRLGPTYSGQQRRGDHDTSSWSARTVNRLEPPWATALKPADGLPWLEGVLREHWLPEDAGLSVRAIEQPASATAGEYIRPVIELSSSRIFLEDPVIKAALTPRTELLRRHNQFANDSTNDVAFAGFVTNGYGVLTYVANLISASDKATPYSMVAAVGGTFLPPEMGDDEILVNEWLADDLAIKPGARVSLSYYIADSASHLTEHTNSFRVRAVVPLKGRYADRTLMPEFPGIAKAETTRDWDTGFPLVYRIRPKDEAYWKTYRGTPKAFITLAAGQKMWANRFGSLTAIRYEVPTNSFASTLREAAYRNLTANLDPAVLGLRYEPVRAQALRAATQSQDFGQLFLGFSIFLVFAALLLMALLFQFGLEQRAQETGTLLAVGFRPRLVRKLLLVEGLVLALFGGVIGLVTGWLYAKLMLWGLTTVWRQAVGTGSLEFHATSQSLAVGLFAAVLVATLTIWIVLRKQARRRARELLAGSGITSTIKPSHAHSRGLWVAVFAGFGALAILTWALTARQTANTGAFFAVGALLLVSGIGGSAAGLAAMARANKSGIPSMADLTLRGAARRRSRSLSTIALLASGTFVIVSLGVFRLDANRDAQQPSSGTGGFSLLGETTLPVVQDLTTPGGRDAFGLGAKQAPTDVRIVPLRVRQGDDASCLNLNRAQKPRLLGVRPELLQGRFTFSAVAKGTDRRNGWALLRNQEFRAGNRPPGDRTSPTEPAEIPAIGDAASIQWALGLKVGESLDYTDERGRVVKLRLVGAVANSILQGSLVIDEAQFVKLFPGESGYRMFLIETPPQAAASISATLTRTMADLGMEVVSTVQRLNAFNAVQNTYIGTFQVLGGLGLLLGSAGLGVIVLRNVLERRAELAVLLAVGFRRRALTKAVMTEHLVLLVLGLALGILAAMVAVLPALLGSAPGMPWRSLTLTIAAVLLNGLLWTWFATRWAIRGNLLEALRNE